jgi:hypothetical protein
MIELEVYCAVVVILLLVDGKQTAAAQAVAAAAVRRVVEAGRRSCDVLAAKLFYYYSWTAELTGALESIRAPLLDLLRTATLRHDSLGQEVRMSPASPPPPEDYRFSPNPKLRAHLSPCTVYARRFAPSHARREPKDEPSWVSGGAKADAEGLLSFCVMVAGAAKPVAAQLLALQPVRAGGEASVQDGAAREPLQPAVLPLPLLSRAHPRRAARILRREGLPHAGTYAPAAALPLAPLSRCEA